MATNSHVHSELAGILNSFAAAAICERVEVGEREVPEQIIPASKKRVIPARTEKLYEYKCKPFLATATEAEVSNG